MKQSIYYFAVPTLLFVSLAYYFQTQLFLSPDVGYLLHASQQIIQGGHYGPDIFETNPPLILYLYLPAWGLVKWLNISIILSIRLYILSLGLISLALSWVLLKKIILARDSVLLFFLYYTLLLLTLFLPAFELGQREHILFIVMMPYVFSTVALLENKVVQPSMRIVISIMAGLGFALKPFFLIPFCLIEGYVFLKTKRLFRIESIVILIVIIGYLISILVLQPDYIKVVLPLVFQFYFPGAKQSWDVIFSNYLVWFCLMSSVAYVFFLKQDHYPILSTVIWLALIGMILAFLVPQMAWFYHILPAASLAIILLMNYIGQIAAKSAAKPWDVLLILLMTSIVFLVPIFIGIYLYQFYMNMNLRDEAKKTLVTYLNSRPGVRSLFCFSEKSTSDCFPLVYLTQSQYSSRFPFFWWYIGLKKIEKNYPQPQVEQNKQFLIEKVAEDLNRYHPQHIVMDVNYDFINYLSVNSAFRNAWRKYQYSISIGQYQIFERRAEKTL